MRPWKYLIGGLLVIATIFTLRQYWTLRNEVAALRAGVPAARASQVAPVPRIAPPISVTQSPVGVHGPVPEAPSGEGPELSPPQEPMADKKPTAEEEQRARAQATKARIEKAFAAESHDPGWAAEAQTQIKSGLSEKLGTDSTIGSIECRSSLCKVEVRHVNQQGRLTFARESLSYPPFWMGEAIAMNSAALGEGSETSVLYLAKPGRSLGDLSGPPK